MGDLDTDYLTAWSLERQRAAAADDWYSDQRCPVCRPHAWHGLRCGKYGCGCESSYRSDR